MAEAVPPQYHRNIIIVGSLAVAYHFFHEGREVRTKDIDCLLSPYEDAAKSGVAMAEEMLDSGWRHRTEDGFGQPQPTPEPKETLSAVRLYPPHTNDWFAEFLAVPASESESGRRWMDIKLNSGYFGLPSFEFLSLAAYCPLQSEFGIQYARPELMALANLLSHPSIAPYTMSATYAGRRIKRSNKDLGRVISLARLSGDESVEKWVSMWIMSLQDRFPNRWSDLAASAGDGFRQLLSSEEDFEEAHHTCVFGLLSSERPTIGQLKATSLRVVQDAINPLESLAT
ncbi:MAG: hypothetical protein JRJ87_19760 [Deltaproteobacteria bacterium]|nr:hypothetical protein [Deltaproteobacteria bacterium]